MPIRLSCRFLHWMPDFATDPSGALWREAQGRPLDLRSTEDAVSGAGQGIDIGVGNFECDSISEHGARDCVQRKRTQALTEVTPSIEIPVVTVVSQALRRQESRFTGVATATKIIDFNLATIQ